MKKRAASVLGLSVVTLVGCGSNPQPNYTAQIHWEPAPEIRTLSQRRIDTKTETVITFDTNARARWQEARRFLLLDRPSRLKPEPKPQ